jgi:hypothetical protein
MEGQTIGKGKSARTVGGLVDPQALKIENGKLLRSRKNRQFAPHRSAGLVDYDLAVRGDNHAMILR